MHTQGRKSLPLWRGPWTTAALALFLACWSFAITLLVLSYQRNNDRLGAYGVLVIMGAVIFIEGPWWRRVVYLAAIFAVLVAITIAGNHLGWSESA